MLAETSTVRKDNSPLVSAQKTISKIQEKLAPPLSAEELKKIAADLLEVDSSIDKALKTQKQSLQKEFFNEALAILQKAKVILSGYPSKDVLLEVVNKLLHVQQDLDKALEASQNIASKKIASAFLDSQTGTSRGAALNDTQAPAH